MLIALLIAIWIVAIPAVIVGAAGVGAWRRERVGEPRRAPLSAIRSKLAGISGVGSAHPTH